MTGAHQRDRMFDWIKDCGHENDETVDPASKLVQPVIQLANCPSGVFFRRESELSCSQKSGHEQSAIDSLAGCMSENNGQPPFR